MKLVIKFGGTSISSAKNIKTVTKYLKSISDKNKIITVCSALSGVTDDLLQISDYIKKGNKEKKDYSKKHFGEPISKEGVICDKL